MLIKIKIQRCLQVLVDYKYKNKSIYLIIMENYIINMILTLFLLDLYYVDIFMQNGLLIITYIHTLI